MTCIARDGEPFDILLAGICQVIKCERLLGKGSVRFMAMHLGGLSHQSPCCLRKAATAFPMDTTDDWRTTSREYEDNSWPRPCHVPLCVKFYSVWFFFQQSWPKMMLTSWCSNAVIYNLEIMGEGETPFYMLLQAYLEPLWMIFRQRAAWTHSSPLVTWQQMHRWRTRLPEIGDLGNESAWLDALTTCIHITNKAYTL